MLFLVSSSFPWWPISWFCRNLKQKHWNWIAVVCVFSLRVACIFLAFWALVTFLSVSHLLVSLSLSRCAICTGQRVQKGEQEIHKLLLRENWFGFAQCTTAMARAAAACTRSPSFIIPCCFSISRDDAACSTSSSSSLYATFPSSHRSSSSRVSAAVHLQRPRLSTRNKARCSLVRARELSFFASWNARSHLIPLVSSLRGLPNLCLILFLDLV